MKTVVRIKFGSHLYGTNTPASDLDYKSVHIPDAEDILLQKVKGSLSSRREKSEGEKNNPGDVDEESYSLQEFFHLLSHGQTVAIDMLFAPEANILEKTPLWDYIVANKEKLLTNKSAAFVGYCRTQANKYGIKGSRVAAARDASEFFWDKIQKHGSHPKVEECLVGLHNMISKNEDHMQLVEKEGKNGKSEWYYECCNRQVPLTASIKLAYEIYAKIHENYGDRARLAEQNEGIDWKALSHAVRVGEEAIELMATGKITFPLRNREHIRAIKQGQIPYAQVAKDIEDLLILVEEGSKISVLRDEPDYEWINKTICQIYGGEIIDSEWG